MKLSSEKGHVNRIKFTPSSFDDRISLKIWQNLYMIILRKNDDELAPN